MADYRLQFIIDAENKAKAAIDQVKGQLEGVHGKLENMEPAFKKMALIGTAGFAAITGAIALSIKESIEMESAQNRLTHILKTSRGATDEQIKSLFEQAEALEKVGVVTSAAIIQAQAQLSTFDLQAESIEKLIPSVLDYVVAEKGASASTEDLKQLTNGLAQALQGNFASLTRTGFVLDDATKELIKNGTEAERTSALVEVLNSTYEGFNEAARKTTEGSLIVMRNEFNNLRQEIGDAFIPILLSLVEKVTPVILKMTEWIDKNPKLTMAIIAATGAVFGLVAILGTLGLILPGIITMFGMLSAVSLPITAIIFAVIAVIGLLIAIGWALYKDWDLIMEGFGLYWQDFKDLLDKIWEGIKDTFKTGVNFLIGLAEGFANMWVRAVNAVIGALNKIKISIPEWVPGIGGRSWGINISKMGEITLPRLAEGGLITRPTAVLAGEEGPEAIVPLSRMALAGVGNINVYIQGGYFLSETVAEELGDAIISKLKRTMKL